MAYVYSYTRLDKNEVFYIGIGSDNRYKRAKNISSRTEWFKKIINKCEYKLNILYDNLTWEEACQKEIELISFYGRKKTGKGSLINLTDGGEGRLGSQNKVTPIFQIDLKGNIIKEWINVKVICEYLKVDRHSIYAALNKKVKTCKKFIWCYVEDYNYEEISLLMKNINKNTLRLKKGIGKKAIKVYQYSLDEKFIQEFDSMYQAALFTKTRASCIAQCLNPNYNRFTANNFIWKKEKIVG